MMANPLFAERKALVLLQLGNRMLTSLSVLIRMVAFASLALICAARLTIADTNTTPSLLDALDQDFDAYVQSIDAESLRQLPRGDALYLLSQAFDLLELQADYHAEVVEDYTFNSSPADLEFFVHVVRSLDPDFKMAYCEKVAIQLPSGELPPDCTTVIAQMFVAQYGVGLSEDVYTAAFLDVLYWVTEADELVQNGTFSDMSAPRVVRHLTLNNDAVANDYLPALANGVLCTHHVKDVAALEKITPLCRVLEPTSEMLDVAKEYRLLNAVSDICATKSSFRKCFVDLSAHYNLNNACVEPAHRAPMEGWFESRFFRSCLEGYLQE